MRWAPTTIAWRRRTKSGNDWGVDDARQHARARPTSNLLRRERARVMAAVAPLGDDAFEALLQAACLLRCRKPAP